MTPDQIKLADTHMKEEYGAKRQTDWSPTNQNPATHYAEYTAGHNTLLARFDTTTSLLTIYRFDTATKLP